MPTRLPNSVQEAWGKQVAEDFSSWLDEYVREHAVRRDERPDREGGSTPGVYREVLSRLEVLEERFVQMEERFDGRFEQIDNRLDRIETRFENRFNQLDQRLDEQSAQFNDRIDAVNERFDGVNERIDRLHEQMRVQTRWTIGTIALFGTIVTVLLAIAEFGG